ncbi:MAG: hypothetical protein LBR38_06740 [Synergistaceae bacterium]|jgi:lipopolysaccharide biosynthesis glycosyltransferase|nr:hypothetical protein [Synergistaceae bacterium]
MSANEAVQVVFGLYDRTGDYSCYPGVAVTSMFAHAHTKSRVNVTILHDTTLTAENRARFERTAERWGQSVSFIDVSEAIYRISEKPDFAACSRGTLFRLLPPEVMDIPKVIYLDCDVIVNLDIAELWGVSLKRERERESFPLLPSSRLTFSPSR